jgi:hypothetical protein
MIWSQIPTLTGCERLTPPGAGSQFYLFRLSDGTGCLVAPYNALTRLATNLRTDAALRDYLSTQRIRIGLRATDVPPADVERQEGYGPTVPGKDATKDFTGSRAQSLEQPVNPQMAPPINRKTDRQENVKTFWETQTAQSHHIVEFNNLETLGFSQKDGSREQDYLQLPAVLLAAEFHQRYISAILRPAQQWDRARLVAEMVPLYRRLYQGQSPLLAPLWSVSAVILAEAGLTGI